MTKKVKHKDLNQKGESCIMHQAKVEYSVEVASRTQSKADQGHNESKKVIPPLPKTWHVFVNIDAKVMYFVNTYYLIFVLCSHFEAAASQ